MCSPASAVMSGGDPFAASSDDTVLVADVGSVTGANQSRGVRFIERFADARSPEMVGPRHGASGRGDHVMGRNIIPGP